MSKTSKTSKAPKVATGADVRAWLRKRGEVVGSRGRLSADQIERFNKAHRGAVKREYVEPRHRVTADA